MLLKFTVFLFSISFALLSYNPWELKITERVVNRKQVSNIILETRNDHYRVTLLVSDRFSYNYKSKSYPFYYKMINEKNAVKAAQKLDKYLDKGFDITLHLKGSEILSFTYHEPLE